MLFCPCSTVKKSQYIDKVKEDRANNLLDNLEEPPADSYFGVDFGESEGNCHLQTVRSVVVLVFSDDLERIDILHKHFVLFGAFSALQKHEMLPNIRRSCEYSVAFILPDSVFHRSLYIYALSFAL